MAGLQELFRRRDTTGRGLAEGLGSFLRACEMMNVDESIRSFMLTCETTPEDLALMTSPIHMAAATTFSTSTVSTSDIGMACISHLNYLLVPAVTIAGISVGLTVERENFKPAGEKAEEAEALLIGGDLPASFCIRASGRFAFSVETGEMLILTRKFRGDPDMTRQAVGCLASAIRGEEPGTGPEVPPLARFMWWGSLQGRVGDSVPLGGASQAFINSLVVDDVFCTGRFAESLVQGSFYGSTSRPSCPECMARDITHRMLCPDAAGLLLPPPIPCRCRESLSPVPPLLDLKGAVKNMRCLRGLWAGEGFNLFQLPGVEGPPLLCNDVVDISRDFSMNEDIASQLQALLLGDAMRAVNATPTMNPFGGTMPSCGTFGRRPLQSDPLAILSRTELPCDAVQDDTLHSSLPLDDFGGSSEVDCRPRPSGPSTNMGVFHRKDMTTGPNVEALFDISGLGLLDDRALSMCLDENISIEAPTARAPGGDSPNFVVDTTFPISGSVAITPLEAFDATGESNAWSGAAQSGSVEVPPGVPLLPHATHAAASEEHSGRVVNGNDVCGLDSHEVQHIPSQGASSGSNTSLRGRTSANMDSVSDEAWEDREVVKLRERKLREIARKQRNRESAARSNQVRKQRNLNLKESLKTIRQRAVDLRTAEMALRAENIDLRRLVAELGAELA